MRTRLFLAALCLTLVSAAAAQEFVFPEAAVADPAALSKAMPALAEQVLAAYKESDRAKYLDNLFRLQMVAGQYPQALKSIASLRELRAAHNPARAAWFNVQYEIYAKAKEDAGKLPFKETYAQAFRNIFGRLDDQTSDVAIETLNIFQPPFERALQDDLVRQRGKSTISQADALQLVHDYQIVEAYHYFTPLLADLVAEDDQRRYVIEKDIGVKAPDGATVCTLVVRPRGASKPLPTLMEFTIYANPNLNLMQARQPASHGYVGVLSFTRGKGCSPDKPVPYERDGSDAAAVIDWISKQPWSDGRVGMLSGSYNGFTQWAAAKHMPKALKALDTGAPAAPGIDVPMEGNVFWSFVYPWPFYTLDNKNLDNTTYFDNARWQRLNHNWYASGRAYRDLDKIDGTPNPTFDQWISHPSYDSYWQSMIPYKEDFTRINIPVLETAGYYAGGPGAALYYFSQHYKYNPTAEHYLVIGPYTHFIAQTGTGDGLGGDIEVIAGYKLDQVAKIDLVDLRYQWFDYIFKGAPKPALLKDRVNYEVTGANVWKHAPSIAAMAGKMLRFYLSQSGSSYRLSKQKLAHESFVNLKVDFADRSDVDRQPPGGVVNKAVNAANGIEFVSNPLPIPTEMSGLFSGHLDFVANKRDFDFEFDFYELTTDGSYILLTQSWSRASYTRDLSHRQLLFPGQRQHLDFQSVRLMSRQLAAGSRVVAVLRIIKEPGRQINYGTGKDVSDETIQDAKEPLEIKWFSSSYVDLPVMR